MAKAQRKYLNVDAAEAVEHFRSKINHEQCHYTVICDYAQNMSYPQLSDEQAGETYYFTPCSVYDFGVVDCTHSYANEQGIPKGNTCTPMYMKKQWVQNVVTMLLALFYGHCTKKVYYSKAGKEANYHSFLTIVLGKTKICASSTSHHCWLRGDSWQRLKFAS